MIENKDRLDKVEVKENGYRKLDSYEEYKKNGNKGSRRLNEANPFKQKIYRLINETKEDEYLNYTLRILFGVCHIASHEAWLERNFESGASNIYRTHNNIQKSKERAIVELLPCVDKIDGLVLKVNKHNSKDIRKWKLVLEIKYKDLTIKTDVNYKKMADYIPSNLKLEETDFEGFDTLLGEKSLNKQQYFDMPLRSSFNRLDEVTFSFIQFKTENKK